VRPAAIVVGDEARKDLLEMLFVRDKQPVETLRTNRAHEALRHAVRLRSPERRTNNLALNAAKYFVETVRELMVPVATNWPSPAYNPDLNDFFPVAQEGCGLACCRQQAASCSRASTKAR